MTKHLRVARSLIPLLLIILLFAVAITSSEAYAGEKTKTMYVKSKICSYFCPMADDDYIVSYLGKGEAITVSTKIYYYKDRSGNTVKWRKYVFHGNTGYVQDKLLTTKNPKYSFRTETLFKTLTLKEGTKLYLQPAASAKYITNTEETVCTLGQTNRWYKVYTQGQVCFIRKNAEEIQKIEDTSFSGLSVTGLSSKTKTKNATRRAMYFYSLMPHAAREYFEETGCTVSIAPKLPKSIYEEAGSSGYAISSGEIHLKEIGTLNNPYRVEMSFLHEAGHILNYPYFFDASYDDIIETCGKERKNMNLEDHYQDDSEFLAEAFEIYVKNPTRLQEAAPLTYDFLTQAMSDNYLLVLDVP